MRKLTMAELNRLTPEAFKDGNKLPLVVVLDNVRSMHNVGSVFRSADAFAIDKIWLCGFTPRPPHRDIQKTALGATETVAWDYATNAAALCRQLKAQGYRLVAIEQVEGSISLTQAAWDGLEPLALIFGNEVEGVQQEVVNICEAAIEIPQSGTKHSLNISVAAGIVLYKCHEWHAAAAESRRR